MPKPLTFWFEFASTYSYLSAMRIEAACAKRGVALQWKPFLLGPVFAQNGWADSPFNLFPVKGANMWRDMQRQCARMDLPLTRPSQFPRNGLLAARVACAHADRAWIGAFVRGVYLANFGADRDISDPAVIASILTDIGQDDAAVLAAAQSEAAKLALRQQTETAIESGLFGAPTFAVGDEVFWGNDRLDDAIDWACNPINI